MGGSSLSPSDTGTCTPWLCPPCLQATNTTTPGTANATGSFSCSLLPARWGSSQDEDDSYGPWTDLASGQPSSSSLAQQLMQRIADITQNAPINGWTACTTPELADAGCQQVRDLEASDSAASFGASCLVWRCNWVNHIPSVPPEDPPTGRYPPASLNFRLLAKEPTTRCKPTSPAMVSPWAWLQRLIPISNTST